MQVPRRQCKGVVGAGLRLCWGHGRGEVGGFAPSALRPLWGGHAPLQLAAVPARGSIPSSRCFPALRVGLGVPGGAPGKAKAVADLGLGQVGVGVCHVEVPRAHPLVCPACCGWHGSPRSCLSSLCFWWPSRARFSSTDLTDTEARLSGRVGGGRSA